ncbi:MAG TPA: DUF3575 domain-containing protein [Bacteroidales bacterium]|jgi:hypothetical protein|nr:DUF3575 domain-containing protein [Bacteroidales bacterium]HRR48359.1 DUF3575 domain-containing protein [Bacteroidales bacterium]HRT33069.1 DUF3575 domain-containing protein [Bacteroidales bacterium]HRT83212.1 DUF3575 domain-containing protein [Bacteroidales bacterium]
MVKKILVFIIMFIITLMTCKAQKYGIGTNILGLGCGSINFEASIATSDKITFNLPFSWNPFELSKNNKIKHLCIQPGFRKWLWHSYSEMFVGSCVVASLFNFAFSKERKEGYCAGISFNCGYAKMINRRFNLEFECAGGAMFFNYDRFEKKNCGEYLGNVKKVKLRPTKLSFSLVYIL